MLGTAGIGVLWASGVVFPFAIPPGMLILTTGALLVGLTSPRWMPAVGAFLGLFVIVGFLISPDGIPNFVGEHGMSVAVGSWIQIAGVAMALVAGVLATRTNYRGNPGTSRQRSAG